MDTTELLAVLARDGSGLLDACMDADPATVIEACPEWRPADLLWHVAEAHRFWGSIVSHRATSFEEVTTAERPTDDTELPAIFRANLELLVSTLTTTDPGTPVWTWSTQRDVAFVIRRMAQETAMHRWDAEHAAGRAAPIDAVLASDGIDEFLAHFTIWRRPGAVLDGSVHIHCTDVAGEWTTHAEGDVLVTVAQHVKGDCALRGSSDALLRALWRRATIDDLDVVGDAAVGAQLLGYAALG